MDPQYLPHHQLTLKSAAQLLDPAMVCNPGKLLPEPGKEDMDNEDQAFYRHGFASLTDQLQQASRQYTKAAL